MEAGRKVKFLREKTALRKVAVTNAFALTTLNS